MKKSNKDLSKYQVIDNDYAVAHIKKPAVLQAHHLDILTSGTCLHYDSLPSPNTYSVCDICFKELYKNPNIVDFRFKGYSLPDN